MSPELTAIIGGILRHFLTAYGGYLVSAGVIKSSDLDGVIGAAMVLIGVLWSWWQKKGQAETVDVLRRVIHWQNSRPGERFPADHP